MVPLAASAACAGRPAFTLLASRRPPGPGAVRPTARVFAWARRRCAADLADRWRGLRRGVRAALLGARRRNALFALPSDALSFAVLAGTAALLALALGRHAISVGAFVALFGGVRLVEGAGAQFAFQFAQGNASVMHVGYFRRFLDLPEEPAPAAAAPLPTPLREGIRCEGLTFTYPGRSAPVLRALDLHLRPGERVALVGEKGAGEPNGVRVVTASRPHGGITSLER